MSEREHAMSIDEAQCNGCVACMQVCPTRALRVRSGKVRPRRELCIDCGACVQTCRRAAIRPRTSSSADLARFHVRIAIPSMVLYGQFGDEVRPGQLLRAFQAVGFDSASDISWTCEMVAAAIDTYLTACEGPWPKISMTCPAVVHLIQLRYPTLIAHLIPIDTPRELAAKGQRRRIAAERGLLPEQIGLFYISPCTALVDAIERPFGRRASHLDGAFSIAELYGPLLRAIRATPPAPGDEDPVSLRGLRWVMASGEIPGMRNVNSITVKGLRDVVDVLDRIEGGSFAGADFINAYICSDGCFSGNLTIAGRYAAQRYLHQVVRQLGDPPPVKEEKVRALLQSHFFDLDSAIEPRAAEQPRDLREAAARQQRRKQISLALPGKDCGACGAPDCDTLAADVVQGEAELHDCPFVRIEELTREHTPRPIGERLVLSLLCPHCEARLTTGEHFTLRVAAPAPGPELALRLSAVLGTHGAALDEGDVLPAGAVAAPLCPSCRGKLATMTACPTCAAPLVRLDLAGGGAYEFCSRRGCAHHEIGGLHSSAAVLALMNGVERR